MSSSVPPVDVNLEILKALQALLTKESPAEKTEREHQEFYQQMSRASAQANAKRDAAAKLLPPPPPPPPRSPSLGPPCPFDLLPDAELTVDQRYSKRFWDHPEFGDEARAFALPAGDLSADALEGIASFCTDELVHDEYGALDVYALQSMYRQSAGALSTKGATAEAWLAAFETAGLVRDPSGRFQVREADDDLGFVSGEAADVKPTRCIVPGLIPAGCQVVFVAKEGALKTTTAVSLAVALAHGREWFGWQTNKCQAAIANFDGRGEDLSKMLHDAGADGKVSVWNYPAHDLTSDGFFEAIERRYGNGQPAVIFIDSLSSGSGGVDEKDPRFALCVRRTAEISARYPITFVFLHHCGKVVKGNNLEDWLRGTSALAPAFDIGFTFAVVSKKTTAPRETIVRVECPRMRPVGIVPPAPFKLRMTDAGLALHDDAARTVRKVQLTDDEKVLAAVKATPGITSAGILAAVGGRHGPLIDARTRLESDGLIENRGSANKPKWFAL